MFRSKNAKTQYIIDNFAHEDEAISSVGASLPEEEKRMQIGPDEGKILHTLVRMTGAKKIVEIGVLNGYSAVWMARAMPDGGKLYALEKNKSRIAPCQEAFNNCGVADKVEIIAGDAHENLAKIAKYGPFDMVFIDADKGGYCKYLDWAEENIRKGGLIVGDNTFLFGAVYGDNEKDVGQKTIDIMKEFNARLGNAEKYSGAIIPTVEGMTVAVKEF